MGQILKNERNKLLDVYKIDHLDPDSLIIVRVKEHLNLTYVDSKNVCKLHILLFKSSERDLTSSLHFESCPAYLI